MVCLITFYGFYYTGGHKHELEQNNFVLLTIATSFQFYLTPGKNVSRHLVALNNTATFSDFFFFKWVLYT